jgi:spore photoproduct lyase
MKLMNRQINKIEKLKSFFPQTLFPVLSKELQEFVSSIDFHLTFQEFRQLIEAIRDLEMWDELHLLNILKNSRNKERVLKAFFEKYNALRLTPPCYPKKKSFTLKKPVLSVEQKESDKTISGLCPVASPLTLCCRLRTIDAVECCAFGCSYCIIQNFYHSKAVFDRDFKRKLSEIHVDPSRFYRFSSGQSSDSLLWGNRFNVLADLFIFAEEHPNILLELKTKSRNIKYLLENRPPANTVVSWSLNTQRIISNEEHFTPSLKLRLRAARRLADAGIKVAFHFHPLIYYEGWEKEYPEAAKAVIKAFKPEEVLFVSFGTLTLIKPAIRAIRKKGLRTKILQMPAARDPKGKITYPDEIKLALFKKIYSVFSPWKGRVYFYLCMEKPLIWQELFGRVYPSNEEFERDFGRQTMGKLDGEKAKT